MPAPHPNHDGTPPPERGRSRQRLEDERFLRGRGRFVDDIPQPGEAIGHVLRSPVAHAVIATLDVEAAFRHPGVLAVLTARDLAQDGIGPLPCVAAVATIDPLYVPPRPALADGRVRHVGDPVAFVVAESHEAAVEASELIVVRYDDLPALTDMASALADDAPLVWEDIRGNVAFRFEKGDRSAVEARLAAAARVIEIEVENNRVVVAPLEPRAAIASYDMESGLFRLVLSGQGVHAIRNQIATVFRLPAERFHLSAPDVGGGFGAKNFLYPEWVLLLAAARRLGRPVRWVSDRSEDFLSSVQGRASRTRAKLALDGEDRFLALHVATDAEMGAYLSALAPAIPTNAAATAMGGVYDIPAILFEVRGVMTNTVPVDAYRGAGKPEANYVIERLVDRAARRLGRDPVALRRRNMIARFPYLAALGSLVERGAFAGGLDKALAAADAAGFAARRREAATRGRLRGMGLGCYLETARGQPGEWAAIQFPPDGTVILALGTQSNGQGHETSFPQIASDLLGLPIEQFRLVQADTELVPQGHGHGGARSLHQGGSALVLAIDTMLVRAKRIAAHLLQGAPDDLVFEGGVFAMPGTGREVSLMAVAEAARDPTQMPAGLEASLQPGLDCHVYSPLDLFTFPNGCHVAEVEIDPDTGRVDLLRYTAVDDFGALINPLLTAGQVQGGLAQGLGQALHERTVYEAESGQFLTASFMDYGLPRAADLPALDITFDGVPSEANPLGVKGSGQAGCIAAPQTAIHAVLDALAPLGIEHIDMPATPERIWRAIRDADRGRRPA